MARNRKSGASSKRLANSRKPARRASRTTLPTNAPSIVSPTASTTASMDAPYGFENPPQHSRPTLTQWQHFFQPKKVLQALLDAYLPFQPWKFGGHVLEFDTAPVTDTDPERAAVREIARKFLSDAMTQREYDTATISALEDEKLALERESDEISDAFLEALSANISQRKMHEKEVGDMMKNHTSEVAKLEKRIAELEMEAKSGVRAVIDKFKGVLAELEDGMEQ